MVCYYYPFFCKCLSSVQRMEHNGQYPGPCVKTRKYFPNINIIFLSCLKFWKTKWFNRNNGEFDVHPTLSTLLTLISSHFLFIYFWLHWVFVAVCGLPLVEARAGTTLHFDARASHCGGFSCCGAWALGTQASVVVAYGLSSCGARAQLLHGMWDLPAPGLKPVSPALAGGFPTTVPPMKSLSLFYL